MKRQRLEDTMAKEVKYNLKPAEVTCLSRCGSYKRYYDMRKHFEDGTCPFCTGNGLDPEVNKILFKNDGWVVWEVGAGLRPHEAGLDLHLMMVPKRHLRHWDEMNECEQVTFWSMMKWVSRTYDIPGGMLFMRFGHMELNGGTEQHINFQIKVPNKIKALGEPMTKSPEHVEKNLARGARFSLLYEQNTTPEEFKNLMGAGILSSDGYQASKL